MTADKQREAFERIDFCVDRGKPVNWHDWREIRGELETIRRERGELRALGERLKVVTLDDAAHPRIYEVHLDTLKTTIIAPNARKLGETKC